MIACKQHPALSHEPSAREVWDLIHELQTDTASRAVSEHTLEAWAARVVLQANMADCEARAEIARLRPRISEYGLR